MPEKPFGINGPAFIPAIETDPPPQIRFMPEKCGMDKSLARYAAPIDAGASQHTFFKHQNPRSVACRAKRSGKSGRAGPEYYQIVCAHEITRYTLTVFVCECEILSIGITQHALSIS
jgi:hypothetical protein